MRRLLTLTMVALAVLAIGLPSVASERGGGVQLLRIVFDPPGSDTGSQASLRKEVVVIVNRGGSPAELTGWTLRDRDRHVFRFPDFTLPAGGKVTIHTGAGANTAQHLFWDFDGYVWNNDGDVATLRRGDGSRVDRCAYSGSGSVASC